MESIDAKISDLSLESKTPEREKLPLVLIVLGMAGSGKTTFV